MPWKLPRLPLLKPPRPPRPPPRSKPPRAASATTAASAEPARLATASGSSGRRDRRRHRDHHCQTHGAVSASSSRDARCDQHSAGRSVPRTPSSSPRENGTSRRQSPWAGQTPCERVSSRPYKKGGRRVHLRIGRDSQALDGRNVAEKGSDSVLVCLEREVANEESVALGADGVSELLGARGGRGSRPSSGCGWKSRASSRVHPGSHPASR